MNSITQAIGILGKSLRLIVRLPGLLVAANRHFREFKYSFLKETDALGIPADIAAEMVSGMNPMRLFGGILSSRNNNRLQEK